MLMKKLFVILTALVLSACSATGDTPAEQKSAIAAMNNQVIADVEKASPGAMAHIKSAPGYATFSNAQINLIFVAAGGGYGVVNNNQTGSKTYMDMYEGGIGFGLGAKDFRAVFVFNTAESMNMFVKEGWAFGAEADAAAKADEKGGEVGGGVTIGDITVYQLTETGLALQATVKGTKYVKNDELN
ncbi:YSC84-related protein [Thalassotalea fonticola]|uniref:YSC84-related protein n=1 Tax=Thalassotalea fonticola TaxID=3065649 RepID=A0ABZ0GMY4_9GAMM|nr:YSC84-related protein [Colwelliaceae bacterium S1-1]